MENRAQAWRPTFSNMKTHPLRGLRGLLAASLVAAVLIGGTAPARGQASAHFVRFTDKGQGPYSLERPEEFLSERALLRRQRMGIALDPTDLPVCPDYLEGLRAHGAEPLFSLRWTNGAMVMADADKALALEALPFVREVRPVAGAGQARPNRADKLEPRLELVPGSPALDLGYGQSQNQVEMLQAQRLHELGYLGQGVLIAVLDAGFANANTLAAFDSVFDQGRVLETRDFVDPEQDVYDPEIHQHGTMVLACMAAYLPGQLVGTAPKAQYMLLRTEDAEAEYIMEEYYWAQAAEYADEQGADLINSSLGYSQFDNPDDDHSYSDLDGNTTTITRAADMAASKGIVVLTSAGNSGSSEWFYISAPADADSVLAVGAVNSSGVLAGFSSRGPSADDRTKPDISAQGVAAALVNAQGQIATANGTSFASPIACGAAALLVQAHPGATNMQVVEALRATANQATSEDNERGFGILDVWHAHLLLDGTPSDQAQILDFKLDQALERPTINAQNHTIFFNFAAGQDMSQCQPRFTLSHGAVASVGQEEQTSGQTEVDLGQAVQYEVVSADGQNTLSWSVNPQLTSSPAVAASSTLFYPNPATDLLRWRGNPAPLRQAVLTDLAGRSLGIWRLDGQDGQLELPQLPAGAYLLRATWADGSVSCHPIWKR